MGPPLQLGEETRDEEDELGEMAAEVLSLALPYPQANPTLTLPYPQPYPQPKPNRRSVRRGAPRAARFYPYPYLYPYS